MSEDLEDFLEFTEYDKGQRRTKRFRINHAEEGTELGEIKWHAPWRRYVFFPYHNTLFDVSCLQRITNFIEGLMKARR